MAGRKKTTTDASLTGLATMSGEPFDYEEAQAKSVLASKRMIEMVERVEERSVGTWYFNYGWPDERLKQWHFVRCGLKRVDSALALAASLRQFGYREAPGGIRCVGFEQDADNMLVMMAPPESRENMRAYKQLQKKKVAFGLADSLSGLPGNVDVKGGSGHGTDADFEEAMRGANISR
tara:strand:+ start:536 stop:1069 length:534 start_codon:yes stop_codon:yes gene_type:complete